MQSDAREPSGVTREATPSDEQQMDFHGMVKIMVEHGIRVIVPHKAVMFNRWNTGRTVGAQLVCAVSSNHDRRASAYQGHGDVP